MKRWIKDGKLDLGPWVGADPDDQSEFADFRRQVAALTREVLTEFMDREAAAELGVPRPGDATHDSGDPESDPGTAVTPASDPATSDPATSDPATSDPATSDTSTSDPRTGSRARGHFDIRGLTPYMLRIAGARLWERLGPGARADLVLVEMARTGATSPLGLRRRLGIPPGTLSGILEAHRVAGLIRRRRHPTDGRSWLLEPTAGGLARAEEAARAWRAADKALLDRLTAREREDLGRLLARAAAALS